MTAHTVLPSGARPQAKDTPMRNALAPASGLNVEGGGDDPEREPDQERRDGDPAVNHERPEQASEDEKRGEAADPPELLAAVLVTAEIHAARPRLTLLNWHEGYLLVSGAGALLGAHPRVVWSLLLLAATLAARIVPAIAIDVPDQFLIDIEHAETAYDFASLGGGGGASLTSQAHAEARSTEGVRA